MKTIIKLLVACSLILTCGRQPVRAADSGSDTNAATAGTVVQDLGIQKVKASHLLAFDAKVDGRPLYVEGALVAVEFKSHRWRLLHAYRHPRESRVEGRGWHIWIVNDAPVIGSKDFNKQPTQAEVEDFLRRTAWKFGASDGFRLVRGQVYADTWQNALGYRPAHEYPKPDA
jgi:hypothetical protein